MERVWSTSHRGFSVRSILTFVLTVFITALLWVTFGSHTLTHAADPSPVTWKGESILYDGHQYFAAPEATAGNSLGLPVGTHYYVYTADTNGAAPKTQKAFVIYFSPGVDPPKETSASYATYDYSAAKVFSNPADKKTVTVTPQGNESSYSSCTIQGIGWIICPITTFLADGMDTIFNIVKGFLVVQPSNTTNTTNDLYIAWNVMRSIANVAFIVVFLIIIYSQITNVGISNYGLKKLLPRLIIAAVLVNVSYIICAIAVDLSNILGYSLQEVFNSIRQNTFNISNDTWADSTTMGWSAVTAFVLSGGAASIGVIIAAGGTVAGAIYLLVPLLIGLIMTILVVLLILAARQAIIIILIVIAPLAFVAYLLPNTEQWFKKWRELFMTMLVFFPAFSLVFGGSQLAGGIIIQNATSITTVIFGMGVQVAPLIITPLLLKLSGGLLGRIAGIVNDPKKGLLDRTKAWSGDRAAMHRQRGLRDNNLKWYNGARRIARALDNNNKNVKERTGNYTNEADNRYRRTARYANLHQQAHGIELEKERIENTLKAHTLGQASVTGTELNVRTIALENSKVNVEAATETSNALLAEYRAGGADTGGSERLKALQTNMAKQVIESAVQKQRVLSAQGIQTQNITKAFKESVELQDRAGGIDVTDNRGAQRALAAALAAQSKAHSEAISNANSILSHYNYSDDLITNIALNNSEVPEHIRRTIRITDDIREAAIAKTAGGPNAGEIVKLMRDLEIDDSEANQSIRQTYVETLLANSNKPKFASSAILGQAKQGKGPSVPAGQGRLDYLITAAVQGDKFGSAELLVTQDPDYLTEVLKTMSNADARTNMGEKKRAQIRQSIALAKSDPQYAGRIGERLGKLDAIDAALAADGIPDTTVGMPDDPTPKA